MSPQPHQPSNANAAGSDNQNETGLDVSGRQLTLPLALEDGKIPGLFRSAIYVSGAFLVAAFAWMTFGQIHELAVAKGKVVPSGHVKLVHHLEGGQVEEVFVEEGQTVEKGTPLLRLKSTASASDLKRLKVRAASVEFQLVRLNALIDDVKPDFGALATSYPDHAKNQFKLYNAEFSLLQKEYLALESQVASREGSLNALLAEARSQKRRVAIHRERVKTLSGLRKKRLSTSRQVLDAKLEYEKVLSGASAMQGSVMRAREDLVQAKNQLQTRKKKDLQSHVEQHAKLMLDYAELRQNIAKHSDRVQRLYVNAPVRGVVQEMSSRSPGEVIKPGGLVAEIVPIGSKVFAEVQLDPRDVGHVKRGDRAEMKISTYDPNVYGTITGEVLQVSPTTIQPQGGKAYYKLLISMDENYLGSSSDKHLIAPGMEVQADVITGSKSIMTYMLKPVRQSLDRAFTER